MIAIALVVAFASHQKIPDLALVAGITLGKTTLEEFEAAHGKGAVVGGGKTTNGAHWWYDATSGAEFYADGWFKSKTGQIVDTVDVTFLRPGMSKSQLEEMGQPGGPDAKTYSVPVIHLTKKELGVLAFLHSGMSRHDVNAASPIRMDKHDHIVARGNLTYPYSLKGIGAGSLLTARRFTTWSVWCIFSPKLDGLMISVSEPESVIRAREQRLRSLGHGGKL